MYELLRGRARDGAVVQAMDLARALAGAAAASLAVSCVNAGDPLPAAPPAAPSAASPARAGGSPHRSPPPPCCATPCSARNCELPRGGFALIFPEHRLVGFCGTPGALALGPLLDHPATSRPDKLLGYANQYASAPHGPAGLRAHRGRGAGRRRSRRQEPHARARRHGRRVPAGGAAVAGPLAAQHPARGTSGTFSPRCSASSATCASRTWASRSIPNGRCSPSSRPGISTDRPPPSRSTASLRTCRASWPRATCRRRRSSTTRSTATWSRASSTSSRSRASPLIKSGRRPGAQGGQAQHVPLPHAHHGAGRARGLQAVLRRGPPERGVSHVAGRGHGPDAAARVRDVRAGPRPRSQTHGQLFEVPCVDAIAVRDQDGRDAARSRSWPARRSRTHGARSGACPGRALPASVRSGQTAVAT